MHKTNVFKSKRAIAAGLILFLFSFLDVHA